MFNRLNLEWTWTNKMACASQTLEQAITEFETEVAAALAAEINDSILFPRLAAEALNNVISVEVVNKPATSVLLTIETAFSQDVLIVRFLGARKKTSVTIPLTRIMRETPQEVGVMLYAHGQVGAQLARFLKLNEGTRI